MTAETLNYFETYFVNFGAYAVKLAEAIDSPYFKVHLDTFHMNIEEKSHRQAILDTGEFLHHVHACENDRGIPGIGLVDWEVFGALARIEYNLWLVLESFTPAVTEIATAAAIWWDMAPSTEGLAFLKKMPGRHLRNA